MIIEADKLRHWIDCFYGYGTWKARFWFVSYEESGGEVPEDVADRINHFHRALPPGSPDDLCDIREMYRAVRLKLEGSKADVINTRYDYRFGVNAVPSTVLKNLVTFSHAWGNEPTPETFHYQKNLLARPDRSREALLSLLPLPRAHNHAWYYSWLDLPGLDFIRNRKQYVEHLLPKRLERILTNIEAFKPDVVLMYGMDNISLIKESVAAFFPGIRFKTFKAIKHVVPQHHRANLNGTTLLITTQIPALRHNRPETGFDWAEFARAAAAAP